MKEKLKGIFGDGRVKLGLGVKLVAGFLIIAIIPMAMAAITAVGGINEGIEGQAQSAINSDLNSANEIINQRLREISLVVNFLSNDENLVYLIDTQDWERIGQILTNTSEQLSLCFLTLVDREGNVIMRANNDNSGDNLSEYQMVSEVLSGRAVEGTVIVEESFLAREGLAERAFLNIVPTEGARPSNKAEETRGMVIVSGVPVCDASGRITGSIIGGSLINNNFQLVDQVGQLLGVTSTIFLDDLRVSTNVQDLAGERALGTRVSEKVAEEVLGRGERYLGKAFVVTEDYITAYDPIKDPMGNIIGINYVGIREAPFAAMKKGNLNRFILIAVISFILAVCLAAFITRSITRPVLNLMEMMQKAEKGDLTAEIFIKSRDELGRLSNSFNLMLKGQMDMIKKVLDTANRVSQSAYDLSAGVEESNAAMEEISSTVEGEVAGKAQDIALISQRAADSGFQTQKIASEGGEAVEEAVKAMVEIDEATSEVGSVIKELNEASKQIGVIVNTITGIAEQTNLLALNAAIEAARAGEQGRGFAVVAEEVRKLAEGSSAAAGEIGNLIFDIQGRTGNAVEKMDVASEIVEKGTDLAGKAREHLKEIIGAVDEVGNFIKEIAAAVEEQSASAEEIAASTNQQTGVLEEISKTTNELAAMAQELNELMSKFKLK